MTFKKWLFEMQNVKYDFSSTQIVVPEPLASKIVKWGNKTIPENQIFVSETDHDLGRENEMHITVLYGIHSEYSNKFKKSLKGFGSIKVELGKINTFTNPDKFDVVVIDVISDDLHALNDKLRKELKFTNNYKEYRPHVTIAYVKKGQGSKYKGNNIWEGEKFTCNEVVFSSKAGHKEAIKS